MKVELDNKYAYLDLGDKKLLCIGTRDEVQEATPEVLNRMIYEAFMTNVYHGIFTGRDMIRH